MERSLARRILDFRRPFVLFHTYSATQSVLEEAISNNKSMDLDICIDDAGIPYLGHSKEYYLKSGESQPETMPFWDAVELVSRARIPVIVDCKHHNAWPVVEEAVGRVGAHRCLVHSFATEFKFDNIHDENDYLTEWSPIKELKALKEKFPSTTTTASCKFLPGDVLLSSGYGKLLPKIRHALEENHIDTVCLNVADNTMTDRILEFFGAKDILPHVGVDHIDVSRLSKIYVGETDNLRAASNCEVLGY
jgi:hypothetical protein